MAGKGYYLSGTSNAVVGASSNATEVEIIGTTTRIVNITRCRVGQVTHKTSEQYELHIRRMTTTGTGTAYTPMLKEPGAGAAAFTVKTADSVEPTYTGTTTNPDPTGDVLSTRWNSLTGKDVVYPMGSELYIAPSASAGVGVEVFTPASTTNFSPVVEVEGLEIG